MLLLLALACRPESNLGPPSPAAWVASPPALGLDVAVAHGAIGRARVRSVNTNGASVPGASASVLVDGVETTVTLDAFGVGEIALPEPGLHTVDAGVDAGTPIQVASYGVDWPGLGGLSRGHQPAAEVAGDAITAGGGILMRQNNTVWWTSPEGFSHPVMVANTPIVSLRAAYLDGDDVLDAAVGTIDSIFVLRGRPGGGLAGVGQLKAGVPLISFDLGDGDNDGIVDLVAVWATEEGDLLDVWRGDGFLNFRAGPARRLVFPAVSVSVADAQANGQEVSVTNTDSVFDQFYANGFVFQPTGPRLEIVLPTSVETWSPGDLNGNGSEELFFASPYQSGQPRELRAIEVGPEARVTTLDREVAAHFTFGDITGEGWPDVFYAEDGGLILAQSSTGDSVRTARLGQTVGGPIGVVPTTGQFMVAEPDRWLWTQTDPGTDRFIRVRSERLLSPGLSLRDGKYALGDLDGDGITEVVGLRPEGTNTELRTYEVSAEGVELQGRLVLLDEPRVVSDVALCGTEAWVLHETGLHRIDVSDPLVPVALGALPVIGRKIACGAGPNGPAAILTDTTVIELADDLTVAASQDSNGAQGIWLDEDGPAVCMEADCGVVRATIGNQRRTYTGSPTGASSDQGPVAGRGAPVLFDVDGNGILDVVFQQDGELTIHRNTPDGFGPVEFHVTREPFQGPLAFADLDGDGAPDAWGIDPETLRLRVTGSLLPAPPDVGDTGDTGDTGTPTQTGSDTSADTGMIPGSTTGDTGLAATGSTGQTGTP